MLDQMETGAATRAGPQRTLGIGRLRMRADAGATRLAELYQEDALRLRLPAVARGLPPEIVTINTAGGLTGGDRLTLDVALDAGASAVVTSQACEKIYRSAGGEAAIETRVTLGAGARLDWLAQPMIVFDRARVTRALEVEMAGDASLIALDGVILGRTAMGERVAEGMIADRWRIRRAGALVLADAFRAGPQVAGMLAPPAALGAARAFAVVICVAPDAEARLGDARAALDGLAGEAAASAWNGMLVARFLAMDGQALVGDLVRFLGRFRGAAMPRTWMC